MHHKGHQRKNASHQGEGKFPSKSFVIWCGGGGGGGRTPAQVTLWGLSLLTSEVIR